MGESSAHCGCGHPGAGGPGFCKKADHCRWKGGSRNKLFPPLCCFLVFNRKKTVTVRVSLVYVADCAEAEMCIRDFTPV